MKKLNTTLLAWIAVMAFALISCQRGEENLTNTITSSEFTEGIFYQQYDEEGYTLEIKTNNPAIFTPSTSKRTFAIEPSGTATLSESPGVYWVDINWADGVQESLPIVIAKYLPQAKNAITALNIMNSDPTGYVIVIRHANANVGEDIRDESIPEWWKSCDPALARQLSEQGKRNSRLIGEGIKKQNIPVSKTISSEFCRATQTLEFMDLGIDIGIDARLNHEYANSKDPMYSDVNAIISENLEDNVLILVGHSNMMSGNPNEEFMKPFNMSDAFLIRRNNDGTQRFVGSIPLSYWGLFD